MSLLEIRDLDVYYGKSQVVNGVSFDVGENDVVSVIGPNGAGKTSILDSIFNFTTWEGEIRFDGRDLDGLNAAEIADLGLGYCMEQGNLFSYMTVRENLLMGAYTHRDSVTRSLEEVFELFPILEERLEQKAMTLSGGQQQMLAIGKTLMARPRCLIFDEPTLGLAPIVIENISEAMSSLRDRFTVLLVEQNATFGFEHADYIVLIETGNVVSKGTPEDLEDDRYIQQAYLGM